MRFQKSPSYFIQYAGLKTACALFRILPYNTAISVGRFSTAMAAKIMHKRFERNLCDIAQVFPDKSPQEIHQIALNSWKNMGQILAEFVKLSSFSEEKFKKYVKIRGLEKLQYAQDHKLGGIIHIGHFTNWEAFGLAASAYGMDKAVLAQRVDNPYVDKETNRLRNIFGGKTLYSNHDANPFFSCIRWLKSGKIMGILTDQNVVASEIFMHFLGRPAAVSPITALLAIRMQVPVFPVIVTREQGQIICTVQDPLSAPKEYSPDNIRLFVRQLTDIYENWIKENPDNWLWAHNRWKRQEEASQWFKEHPECTIK